MPRSTDTTAPATVENPTTVLRPGSPEWFQARAVYRRSPEAREDARRQIEESGYVETVLQPTPEDEVFAQAHTPPTAAYPVYPRWVGSVNGVEAEYEGQRGIPVGVPVSIPRIWLEVYANSRRQPIFRKQPGDAGVVFSRDIPEGGAVLNEPVFGR